MLKSMNRFSGPAAALAFITMPSAALASDARIEGLGIDGIYVDDYEGFRLFPTVFSRVKNMVAASLGRSGQVESDNYFGVIASGDRDGYGTFSVFLRGRSPFLDGMSSAGTFDVSPNIDVPSQQYDLGWSKQFRRLAVGARFEHARSRDEIGEDEAAPAGDPGFNDWNTTAFHGGVKIDTREADFLELGGELRFLSFKNTLVDPDVEDDAGASYRLSARYWAGLGDRVEFVPAFSYAHIDATREGSPADQTFNMLTAGGAFQFDVNQDNLLFLGASLNRAENNADDISVTWVPNLFGALEWDIKSWLTGRVGAQQAMRVVSEGDERNLSDQDFRFGLGVGLHFNNFDVDATLNEDFPFTGGYFISGDRTAGDLFGRVTGVYYF